MQQLSIFFIAKFDKYTLHKLRRYIFAILVSILLFQSIKITLYFVRFFFFRLYIEKRSYLLL